MSKCVVCQRNEVERPDITCLCFECRAGSGLPELEHIESVIESAESEIAILKAENERLMAENAILRYLLIAKGNQS